MVDMEKDMTEALRTMTRMAEVLKDYEGLRAQFNNVLDPLLPGDGNDLLPLRGQDWPALKDQVTGWMAEQLQGMAYGRRLRQTFGSGAGRVDVEAEHLLDDYWWVTATPAGTDPDDAAMAVVRIQGQQAPPALRGGLLGPHLLTGRRGGAAVITDRSRWLPRPGGR